VSVNANPALAHASGAWSPSQRRPALAQEAMGANVANTVAEGVAPMLARVAHCRAGLRILSNLALLRTATASCRLPFDQLGYRGPP
jgi:hydroxymethylglutaryl-CoA reductase